MKSTETVKQLTFPTVTAAADAGADDEAEIAISTIDLDRDQDRLRPEGMRTEHYLRNPVVLFAHNQNALPVATTTRLTLDPDRGLRARFRWLKGDPFAERVRNAFDQGVLRGASVAFLPIASKPNPLGGLDHTEVELVEWSLVPLPSNPSAVRTLKALGLAPRPRPEGIIEAVRRGVADAFDPEGARLRRAVETGVRRALRKTADAPCTVVRVPVKAAVEAARRGAAASRRGR